MNKTTHKNLSERLTKYGALSVAIACGAEVNSQIKHSDPINLGGAEYIIDLDNDATNDFRIFYNSSQNVLGFEVYGSLNGAIGSISNSFQYPFALNSGAIISGSTSVGAWIKGSFQIMNWNSCTAFPNNQWCDGTDKYLGLKFTIDLGPGPDPVHYGWAKVNVPTDPSGWIIKDFAYNTTPYAPIEAGQTTLGIDDNIFSSIKVVALNKSIGLYNLQDVSRYSVINMTGQEVLKGETQNKDYVIEAPTLASGVYIVELNDTNSDAVMRKKVVLQ